MALPTGIVPKTVTLGIGSFFDGNLVSGTVTITAPVNVVHTPTGRPLYSSVIQQRFVDGEATFLLCPTDADGLNRKDWTYKLNVQIDGAIVQPEVVYFLLPSAGPDVLDLDTLVTVPSSAGTPISVDALTVPGGGATGDALVYDGSGGVAWGTAGLSAADVAGQIGTAGTTIGDAARAAYEAVDPVLSNFSYDPATGNLLSYQENGTTITLTYNSDGTVATSQRGSNPAKTYSYSGGTLVGVA